MLYNSPSNKNKYELSKDEMIKLINIWNKENKENKIKINKKEKEIKLLKLMNEKTQNICNSKAWCIADVIHKKTKAGKLKEEIKKITDKEFKPPKPREWLKNPKEWLSNYDIEKILNQYDIKNTPDYKYKFLGVHPIDFTANKNGTCLYSSICALNIKPYIDNKIKYLGLITNLDKHNEPGSHWTSTFIILDPKIKAYGAYYYDSNAVKTPSYVLTFINNVKSQLDKIYENKVFKITYNKTRHQFKNTECGVFSIMNQLCWLKGLKKNKNTSFEDITEDKTLTDDNMNLIRNKLFRPNIKEII